jgi:A/G-specific adenine glycosylase
MPKSHVLRTSFPFNSSKFRKELLQWYDVNRRALPWRAPKGQSSNPYRVWLSEIMLQQTTVPAVIPYFLKFIAKWPKVEDLAAANQEDVMAAWAGLGYYARARNLVKCARSVAEERKGEFPSDSKELLSLAGIGPYTAAAIASIAFQIPCVVVDGNIERIAARIFARKEPLPAGKKDLHIAAARFFDGLESGQSASDFPQALMDLGAAICTPQSPKCGFCPVSSFCEALKEGIAESLPARQVKLSKPSRQGKVFWIESEDGKILVERREDDRMLGGMMGLPTSSWDKNIKTTETETGVYCEDGLYLMGVAVHSFTHFNLRLEIWGGRVSSNQIPLRNNQYFLGFNEVGLLEMPSLFRKVVRMVTEGLNLR